MNEFITYPAAAFSALTVGLIALSIFKMRMNRAKQNRLPEPFEDHQAFHGTHQHHFIYSMYVFTEYTGLTRMTLHFEHFPTLDDVYRAINIKYGDDADGTLDYFRKVIWNLGIPDKPNDHDHSTVSRGANSVTVHRDLIVEN